MPGKISGEVRKRNRIFLEPSHEESKPVEEQLLFSGRLKFFTSIVCEISRLYRAAKTDSRRNKGEFFVCQWNLFSCELYSQNGKGDSL